ncbi:MAG: hypothetical protein JJT78_08135, partial [Leptospira sp.]|nr:hypothetical protein [Leptospira sp.]
MKANLTKNKITIAGLITLLSLTTACFDNGKVDQSEADTNLVLGLLVGQEQGKNAGRNELQSSLIEIRGLWKTSFYSGGNFNAFGSGRLVISTNPDGLGSWATTSSGSFGNENMFRIIELDNNKRSIIFQQGKSNSNDFSGDGGSDNR